MREFPKNILIVLICSLCAFFLGYTIGSIISTGQITGIILKEGFKYLDYKNVTFDMSKGELINYFYKYFLKGG
jgi:hypothetical protein